MKEYIKPELLILVPVLFILGEIMKNTKLVKDNYIPAILGAAGAAVYTDQIIKQNFGK